MSDDFNYLTGQIASTAARNDANRANARAHDAEMEALSAKAAAARARMEAATRGGNADLERKVRAAQADKALAEAASTIFVRELKAKEELIVEWKHSNEAFKQMAREYGKRLGLTDEQRQADFDQKVVDVAEADIQFANTQFGQNAKARLVGPK